MQKMRTDHDALHRESASRLDASDSMKQECASVRKLLRNYVRGYVFLHQKIRIRRHLSTCAVCSSEHQALKMEINARQQLNEVSPPEGLLHYVQAGTAGLANIKKLLYRPLWMAVIAGALVLLYVNIASRRGDPEIDNLEKSLPAAPVSTPAVASSSSGTLFSVPSQPVTAPPAASRPAHAAPASEPLVVAITPGNGQGGLRRINEILAGHGSLQNLRFSEAVQEVSGKLPHADLLMLFDRIASAGKVSYSRRRLDSFPADQPVPFVMKLKLATGSPLRPTMHGEPKVALPAEPGAMPAPASAQTTSP